METRLQDITFFYSRNSKEISINSLLKQLDLIEISSKCVKRLNNPYIYRKNALRYCMVLCFRYN